MGIGSGTAALIGGLAAAGGSVASGVIGSNAAGNAAQDQSKAAEQAAQLQYQASQNALGFQEGTYNNSQQELAPWLQSGAGALSNLDYLTGIGQPSSLSGQSSAAPNPTGAPVLPNNGVQSNLATPNGVVSSTPALGSPAVGTTGVPGSTAPPPSGLASPPSLTSSPNTSLGGFGSLMSPYPGGQCQAPTLEQAEQQPGYQFQLQQGSQLLQQSAAARGNLLTGGTAEALQDYGQGLAQTDYQNVYNDALNTYGTNYNAYQQQQANQYNRLASLAGVGQTAAGQLGTLGQNASNSVASNLLGTASQRC